MEILINKIIKRIQNKERKLNLNINQNNINKITQILTISSIKIINTKIMILKNLILKKLCKY